jgi:hypothetical protein
VKFSLNEKSQIMLFIRSTYNYNKVREQCQVLQSKANEFEYRSKETVLKEQKQK